MATFEHENSLSALPLPNLQDTLRQLEECIKPLHFADGYYKHPLYPEENYDLPSRISQFASSDAARKLQGRLKDFESENHCYLDRLHLDINNHSLTQEIQDDVLPRNPFLILSEDAVQDVRQEERAGVLCYSAMRFISALKNGFLPPDCNAEGDLLTMVPYLNMFGSTRCPVFRPGEVDAFDLNKPYTESDLDEPEPLPSDVSEEAVFSNRSRSSSTSSEREEPFRRHGITINTYRNSKHILIISKGQYYILEVLDDNDNLLYDGSDLSAIFLSVLKDCQIPSNLRKSTALGSLTSYSLRNWRYARKRLHKRFPDELTMVDSALFVVVLDESDGSEHETDDRKRLFYGTSVIDEKTGFQIGSCISRWYDKLQLVVTADSKAAVIWDSFTCDGSVVLRFASDMYAESILRLAREVNNNDSSFSLWPQVQTNRLVKNELQVSDKVKKIIWSFSHILNTHVHLSETNLTDLICKHNIVHKTIPFGRRMARELGIKADSMIQIAIQVAHYALYGKLAFSFEPVSTRSFKNSRSVFVPVQNQHLLDLCQLFISNYLDEKGKLEKFLAVCDKHTETVSAARRGQSFEKHFNALKFLFQFRSHYGIQLDADEMRVTSALFDSELLSPFSAPDIIAANCGNTAMTAFGINPAVPQGFGIGYILEADQCDLTVTSQFRQGERLLFMLEWVLTEIREYWNLIRNAEGCNGVKISPLVDKLYKLDNAFNTGKHATNVPPSLIALNSVNGGYGLFDLRGHVESRTPSRPVSRNNSSMRLNELILSSNLTRSTSTDSVPTEKEKQNTGHQISKLDPFLSSPESSDSSSGKRNNVINSRFEINFDRSSVGKKVGTPN